MIHIDHSFGAAPHFCVESAAPKKHLSPLRYPGGKSWLAPRFGRWLGKEEHTLVEPFAGGGSISLYALSEGLVRRAIICEIDPGVSALWETMIGDAVVRLIHKIRSFVPTVQALNRELQIPGESVEICAWQTLLRNRFSFGGILAPGASLLRRGEGDRGFASRWYPDTLINRIIYIHKMRHRIEFRRESGLDVLSLMCSHTPNAVCFADPPYPDAGGRLYSTGVFDHERLFAILSMWPGRFMLTYEESSFVRTLATRYDYRISRVAMQARTHRRMHELIISNTH